MAKALNLLEVNLAFTADTSKAKAQLQDLQKTLLTITQNTGSGSKFGLTKEINEATIAAAKLQLNLHAATNQDTGKLDLGRFIQLMNQSGMSLEKYQLKLSALGPDGERAFAKLAQSITLAEIPLRRTSATLELFKTTLMNTARWQISSSILHGFMGAILSAFGYAKDLNESLNNIRIVTGQSSEQMAEFAERANKAAQALSTTTTAYTDAALIYYQLGIRDQGEIQERTDTTIKLANVSRQSAEEVSSQMTAIWNNFDDGSKTLEYYADAITALGASTASSSSEIATGMSKFAAIAKTVGLSYEYAAAGLATVVAQTRQSADTVGTAFRTLFSRLEGLKLGETLEDGVDLNKYSTALLTIGVQLLDVNGNIKDMDTILDETAAHWENLSLAQKVAFAETVGGVRQYTNLIALMDNWDKMLENITTARDAEGTLLKLQDIYAEGWEASSKRVKAAAEDIYKTLLDDDFFIGLNNGFATVLKGVNLFIDSIGGLKGVLLTIGAIITTVFLKNIATGLSNMAYSIKMMTAKGKESLVQLQREANLRMANMGSDMMGTKSTNEGKAMQDSYLGIANLQDTYIRNADKMNAAEKAVAQTLLQRLKILSESLITLGQELDKALLEEKLSKTRLDLLHKLAKQIASGEENRDARLAALKILFDRNKTPGTISDKNGLMVNLDLLLQLATALEKLKTEASVLPNIFKEIKLPDTVKTSNLTSVLEGLRKFKEEAQNLGIELNDNLKTKIETVLNATTSSGKVESAFRSIKSEILNLDNELAKSEVLFKLNLLTINNLAEALVKLDSSYAPLQREVQHYIEVLLRAKEGSEEYNLAAKKLEQANKLIELGFAKVALKPLTLSLTISKAASSMMSFAMVITLVKGLITTLSDESVGAGEKITQVMMTLGMTIPMISTALLGLTATIEGTKLAMWELYVIIGAIIAVASIIVGIVKEVHSNSLEGRLKKAEESAEKFKTALNEAREEANKLNSVFDSYNSAVEKLKECTEGTDAWYQALQDANGEILNIIENYPELAAYMKLGSNGLLYIDEEAVNNYKADLEAVIRNTEYASMQADQKVRELLFELLTKNFQKTNYVVADYEMGGSATESINKFITDHLQELYDMNLAEQESFLQGYIKTLETDENKIETNIGEWIVAINELTATMKNNELIKINSNMAFLSKQLANNEKINDSNYKEQILLMASTNFDKLVTEQTAQLTSYYESLYSSATEDELIGEYNAAATKVYADLFDRYAKAAGIQNSEYELSTPEEIFYFTYENGKRKENNISIEDAIKFIAPVESLENIDSQIDEIIATIEGLYESDDKSKQGVGNLLAYGNFGKASIESISELLSKNLTNEESVKEYLDETLGGDIYAMYGEELGHKYVDAYLSAIDDINPTRLKEYFKDTAFSDYINDLSIDTVKTLQLTIGKMTLGPAGKLAGEEYSDAIMKAINQIPVKDLLKALEKILTIDWSNYNAFDLLSEMVKDFGIVLDGTDPYWKQFIENMRIANASLPDFTDLKETLKDIASILDDLEYGKQISEDNFNQLIEAGKKLGVTWNDFFLYQANGTYRFLGNSALMLEVTKNLIALERESLALKKELLESFLNEDFGTGKPIKWNDTESFDKLDILQKLKEDSGSAQDILLLYDYDDAALEQIINRYNQAQERVANAAKWGLDLSEDQETLDASAAVDRIFLLLYGFSIEDFDKGEELLDQAVASMTTSFDLLRSLSIKGQNEDEEGDTSIDAYRLQLLYLIITGLEAALTLDDINSLISEATDASSKIGEDALIPLLNYAEALTRIAELYSNCTDEIDRFNLAIVDGNEEQIAAAESALSASVAAGEYAKRYDLSAESIEEYAELLKELELYQDSDARMLIELAKDQMRYDRAVASSAKNMSKWKSAIDLAVKSGSLLDSEVISELSESYGDLLDLDPSSFSAGFLKSAHNLDLLNQALTGTPEEAEAAYNELQNLALAELEAKFHLDTEEAQIKIAEVEGLIDLMPDNVTITADADTSGALAAMTDLVNAAGMTADLATDYLSTLGVDAEVIEVPTEAQETNEMTAYDANPRTVHGNVSFPRIQTSSSDHGPVITPAGSYTGTWEYDALDITPRPVTQTTTKENKAFSLKVISANKSSGGGVKRTVSPVANSPSSGGKGGGGCFVAGTLITMKGYYKNIEEIKKGDIVLSYNELTKQNEYSKVLLTMIHLVYENIYSLYIENEVLEVTGIHRFLITRNNKIAWIAATDLQIGDLVLFANGTLHRIYNITTDLRAEVVYNFEVSNNHNYYVGKNQILAHNKGGGGGGGRQKEVKKTATDKSERYHVINAKLADLNRRLEEAGKRKDEQEGKAKHEAALLEIKDLQTTIELNKEKLKEAENWLAYDKQVLLQYGDLVLNKDGEILNYDLLWQDNLARYNQAIMRYNASAQEDADKKALEAAEEQWQAFQDNLKLYEETLQLTMDLNIEINDLEIQKYLLKTEDNIHQVEYRLEFDDRSKAYFDYLISKSKEFNSTLNQNAEILKYLGLESKTLINEVATINTGIDNTLRHYLTDKYRDKYGNLLAADEIEKLILRVENNETTIEDREILSTMPAEELQQIFDWQEQLVDKNQEIMENILAVAENVGDFWENTLDKLERVAKPIERAIEGIQHYKEVVDIVGKDLLGITKELEQQMEGQEIQAQNMEVRNARRELQSLKEAYDRTTEEYQHALEIGATSTAEALKGEMERIEDMIDDATSTFYEKWEEALRSITEAFQKNIDDIKDDALDKLASPIFNFTWLTLQDALDYSKEAADNYVPVYKEIYELSKLNRDINKSINDTDNLKNKEALRDLQKEINKLEEDSGKISQYDLDNARKQYELTLARLQLEEAQNVKDIVRLSKNAQGDWSYIYTANQENVEAAELNYEDKLFAMLQANAKYINDLQDELVDLEDKYYDKMADINNDLELSAELKEQALQELEAWHADLLAYYSDEMNKVLDNNNKLYNEDWKWYSDFTAQKMAANEAYTEHNKAQNGYRLADEEEYIDNFNETLLGQKLGYDTVNEYAKNSADVAAQAVQEMTEEYQIWKERTESTMLAAGTSINSFAADASEDMDLMIDKAEEAQVAFSDFADEADEEFKTLIERTDEWITKYAKGLDKIIGKNETLIESILKLNNLISAPDANDNGTEKGRAARTDTQGEKLTGPALALAVAKDMWTWDDDGSNRTGWAWSTGTGGLIDKKLGAGMGQMVQSYLNKIAAGQITVEPEEQEGLKQYHMKYFDTGGYTGDWNGNGGRLAVLHQKEIVLNQMDTDNLLTAVNIVRDIAHMIDLNAKATEVSTGNISAIGVQSGAATLIEQSVHITADFPAVSDRNEIEAAFEMLINEASQYAYRK